MTQATSAMNPAAPGHALPAVVVELDGLSLPRDVVGFVAEAAGCTKPGDKRKCDRYCEYGLVARIASLIHRQLSAVGEVMGREPSNKMFDQIP